MSNKLIDLNALSEYKTNADLKYQDKLTAGNCFSIISNVISANPTYVSQINSGSYSVASGSVKNLADVTLAPGNYILMFTCRFRTNATGYRQCGFSTKATNLDNFGSAYWDSRQAISGRPTNMRVFAVFQVSASSYPDGRTFYLNVRQNSGSNITADLRCYYMKF